MGKIKAAIQMYNFVRGGDWAAVQGQEDVNKLLEGIAAAGFDGVEWCNFQLNNVDLGAIKAKMEELGLETCGMHFHYFPGADLEGSVKVAVERTVALGCKALTFAFSTPETFGMKADENGKYTVEQIDQWAAEINKVLDAMKAAAEGTGIEIVYHNHAPEYLKGSAGEYVMDMLTCAGLEVDVYWASKGMDGKVDSALEYVKSRPEKVYFIHMKDGLDGSIHTGEMCGWGKGTFNLQKIIDVAKEMPNVEWVVAENDNPLNFGTNGLEDAKQSGAYKAAHLNLN